MSINKTKQKCNQDHIEWNKPGGPLPLTYSDSFKTGFGNVRFMDAILVSVFILVMLYDLPNQDISWKKIPLNALIKLLHSCLLRRVSVTLKLRKAYFRRLGMWLQLLPEIL